MATPQFQSLDQPVDVIHDSFNIGTATVVTEGSTVRIDGHYNWPPDSIAIVQFSFSLELITDELCRVAADWPGFITAIPPTEASYLSLLLLGRPDLLITTPSGDTITFVYVGPPGDPEKVTGIQVSIAEGDSSNGVMLLFRFTQQ